MSRRDRAALARSLFAAEIADGYVPPQLWGRGRLRFVLFVVGCCLVLIGWIVLLAATLPINYVTRQWRLAWIGFDVALLVGLALTGWAAWRRRQLVILTALVTATLLCADAWFDVLLSWGSSEQWQSIASAVLVELPLAALLLGVAHRGLRLTIHAVWTVTGQDGKEPTLPKMPLLGQPIRAPRQGRHGER